MSERKPIILIVTSHEELGHVAETLSNSIKKNGTHNVVIISDDKYALYGKKSKFNLDDKIYSLVEKYQENKENKGKEKAGKSKVKGRVRRIRNAVLRFNPTCIVTVTPKAHYIVCETKKQVKFNCPVIDVVNSFIIKKNYVNDETNAYIVDNQEEKQALIQLGVTPKDVLVMGLPYLAEKKTPLEIESLKQDLGLPKITTVLAYFRGMNMDTEIFNLLIDQGRICNIVAFIPSSQTSELRKIIDIKKATNIQIVTSQEEIDKYLSVSDIVVTNMDYALIYKSFQQGKPVICHDPKEEEELSFLLSKGLIMRANEPIDVVDCLYSMLQTNKKESLINAGSKWVELADVDNIANYIAAYINTDD